MNNDNYKATTSALMDPEPARRARPRNVNIALGLIGGGVLIRLILGFRLWQDVDFEFVTPAMFVVPVAGWILIAVICHQIAHGKNWARLLLLLLTLLVFAQLCFAIGIIWRKAPDMWDVVLNTNYLLNSVLPLAMNMAALHLLYFSSGDWFGARKS